MDCFEEARQSKERKDDEGDDDHRGGGTSTAEGTKEAPPEQITVTNEGELLLDATCTPADIAYPTDLSLLNQAREKLEAIIDVLHEPHLGQTPKPPMKFLEYFSSTFHQGTI